MSNADGAHATWLPAVLLLAAAAIVGCGDGGSARGRPDGGAVNDMATSADAAPAEAADTGASPREVATADAASSAGVLPWAALHETLQMSALGFDYEAGDWLCDFGDAACYGLAFYATAGLRCHRADHVALADEVYARNVALLGEAAGDVGLFFETMEESQMAALGVIEATAVRGVTDGLAELDALVDLASSMVESMGTYLDIDLDDYALRTYGPTTITAEVALLNLRHAELLDTPLADERARFATHAIEEIDARVRTGEHYRLAPGVERRTTSRSPARTTP